MTQKNIFCDDTNSKDDITPFDGTVPYIEGTISLYLSDCVGMSGLKTFALGLTLVTGILQQKINSFS
jgi:hypothetical protein